MRYFHRVRTRRKLAVNLLTAPALLLQPNSRRDTAAAVQRNVIAEGNKPVLRHGSRDPKTEFTSPLVASPIPSWHFSYKDIRKATDGFLRIIESRSWDEGATYKAKFGDGLVALVKEVRALSQGKDAFYKEVRLLGRLHHRNLIVFRGFSWGRKRFLVFEYTENGSLREHLNDPLKTPLNWRTRLKIAVGVAAGLEYLHFFCDPPMSYVSINSSSIMLDENFAAKLSDFGPFSSDGNYSSLPHSSGSKECIGQKCGKMVFQIGVLILELITGQSSWEGGTDIIQWVQETSLCKTINNMIDPDLGDSYDSKELQTLLAVARFCIKSEDKPACFVSQIHRYLQTKLDSP